MTRKQPCTADELYARARTVRPLTLSGAAATEMIRENTGWRRTSLITKAQARAFRAVTKWYETIGEYEMAEVLEIDLNRFFKEGYAK